LFSEEFRDFIHGFQIHEIIVANKMDCESAKVNLKRFKKSVKNKIVAISAKEKDNLDELIDEITKKL